MSEPGKRLTLLEASALIAGIGMGGGIMAVPYLASFNSILQIIGVMAVAYVFSLALHLMIAETVLRDGGRRQFVELFDKYVFRGAAGFLTWVFFALLVCGFIFNLAGYIAGGGEIVAELAGLPLWSGELIVYVVAAGVVFFGLKAIGMSEKFAILGGGALLAILSAATLMQPTHQLPMATGAPKEALALYGMVMFGFACFFSIPQAVEGLSWNRRLVPWSVAIGIAINFVFMLVLIVMAMLASGEVTEVAIIGWGDALGKWALALGSLFALMAILTSYWAVSYAMAVILQQRLGMNYRLAWLISTAPSAVLALSGLTGFMGFMRMTGGAIAVMLSILVVPAFRASRRMDASVDPGFDIGPLGSVPVQVIVVIAYVLMGVGSIIPIG